MRVADELSCGIMNTAIDFLPDPAATARINRIKLLREIENIQKVEDKKPSGGWGLLGATATTVLMLSIVFGSITAKFPGPIDWGSILLLGTVIAAGVVCIALTWTHFVCSTRDARWSKVAELLQILAKEVAELKAEK